MGSGHVDPKVWVLEQLLAEEGTSLEVIQACQVPDEALEAPWLKHRVALRLLADALEGGRVQGALLQPVRILADPELGWEQDAGALILAVKVQACSDILKGDEGTGRRDWKGFSTCVGQLFVEEADRTEESKAAHKELIEVVKPSNKKQREAALEKLVKKHPLEPVLEDLKELLKTAAKHLPAKTSLEQLEQDVEAGQYVPTPVEAASQGPTVRSNAVELEEDGLDFGGGPEDLGEEALLTAQVIGDPSEHDATPPAAKLGPRRKHTEKRAQEKNAVQSSPDQSPIVRRGSSKKRRQVVLDEQDEMTAGRELVPAGNELALVKRGPGRPRIHPKPDPDAPKRPRGRPRVYENGAPPRSPLKRRKSTGQRAPGASPEQTPRKGGEAEEEEQEEETTPLKRRRVVADRQGADGAGPSTHEDPAAPAEDTLHEPPPPDSYMDDPPVPNDLSPPQTRQPSTGAGLRQQGFKILEEMENANPAGGQGEGGAQYLTLSEDGSCDYCWKCDAKIDEVGELLLCTGCPNAICYPCAGMVDTPQQEYVCVMCLERLKRRREKEIRLKLESSRRRTSDPTPIVHKLPPAPPQDERLDPGPSQQPGPSTQASAPEKDASLAGRLGEAPEQAEPGLQELPELPEEDLRAPEGEAEEREEKGQAPVEERGRTEEGRRNNRYWTPEEVQMLKEAVAACVTEENSHRVPWEGIRQYGLRRGYFQGRKGVDMKDKWRNIKKMEERAGQS